ncbi:MAG: hypothetical protein HY014_10290 [Acidobacteria bacterium]|nr:hypothetical protein [Acidobacteriota bacterium]MBI3488545.1 hypothetical protein [Acidobacteriota bacterium]
MKAIAHDRYGAFDQKRRQAEALAAAEDDIKSLELVEKQAKGKRVFQRPGA